MLHVTAMVRPLQQLTMQHSAVTAVRLAATQCRPNKLRSLVCVSTVYCY